MAFCISDLTGVFTAHVHQPHCDGFLTTIIFYTLLFDLPRVLMLTSLLAVNNVIASFTPVDLPTTLKMFYFYNGQSGTTEKDIFFFFLH